MMCVDMLYTCIIINVQIAIKAADVSNPTRPLEISKTWSEHIMEEFFRQGIYIHV